MKKLTFKCETITPLILGEAKKEMVELRPPAIKAAMRFWWRAKHAYLEPGEMKKQESEIFGGGGNEAKSAKFDIVISEPSKNSIDYNYTPNESPRLIENIFLGITTGSQYLMYTLLYLKKKGKYFPSTTQFDVSFYFDNDNTDINQILASFWLLVFFGNIGERSRRGLGSFKVTNIVDNNHIIGNLNFTSYNIDAIQAGLTLIRSSSGFIAPEQPTVNNTYSHIFNKEIYVSNTYYPTWKDALNDIGSKMKSFRLNNTDSTISNTASGHLFADKSAIFGLPIKHRTCCTVLPVDFERRASPLIIKIIQGNPNEFRWVLTRLGGDFLPTGHATLSTGGIADATVLTRFLNVTTLNMTKI